MFDSLKNCVVLHHRHRFFHEFSSRNTKGPFRGHLREGSSRWNIRHLSARKFRLKPRTFSELALPRARSHSRGVTARRGAALRRYGVAGTIDRSLFIGSNSSPFRKNICLGIERFCTAGNDGAQRRAILRERANRRQPTIPTS